VGDKDLEAIDNLSEGHRFILPPVSNCLGAFDQDDEVVVLAFEVDSCLVAVAVALALDHVYGCFWVWLLFYLFVESGY